MASGRAGVVAAAVFLAIAPVAPTAMDGAGGQPPFRVRTSRRALAASLEQALSGAADRLAVPACAAIFADFADGDGRALQANLDALGETGPGYLRLIGF